jgi:hypothetical protein
MIYGNQFPVEERQGLVNVVHSNIISNARALVQACEKIVPLEDPSIAKDMAGVPDAEDTVLDKNVAAIVKRVWADNGAQATWARRAEYHIQDALAWLVTRMIIEKIIGLTLSKRYMNQLDRISESGYIPSVDDILRARVRTSGIVEETYKIDGVEFVMYDVGGQRNERKKWIHCFDAVTAVIFVAAISEYDQFLYEDDQMYRMDEAVLLFDEICNSKFFKTTSMILFLNKNDLFREKLKTIPVRVDTGSKKRYENFNGPFVKIGSAEAELGNPSFEAAYDAARDYFLQLFLRRNQQMNKEIYHHVTCATDTSNIKVVFNAAKDIILKDNLRGSGFMD